MEKLICITVILLSSYSLTAESRILSGKYRKGFLGYYTILSNFMVLAYFTGILLSARDQNGFLRQDWVVLSVTLCITVTFLTYHFLIHPELVRLYRNGENVKPYSLANLSLHYFVPLLTIAYWIFFGHKADLNYLDALRWLIIPLTYLGYIFLRRALKIQVEEFCHGYYPYSFIDLEQLGVAAVLRNSLLLLAGYALLGAVFVFIAGII